MIELTLNLPERFVLVSLHRMYNGYWSVCVKAENPGERVVFTYASAELPELADAARLAVERCLYKETNPEMFTRTKPVPEMNLDLKELGL